MQALSFCGGLLFGPTSLVLWLWFWSISGGHLSVIWCLLKRCISHVCLYGVRALSNLTEPWVAPPRLGPLRNTRAEKQVGIIPGLSAPKGQGEWHFWEALLLLKVQKSVQELVFTQTPDCLGQHAQKCWHLSWKCKCLYIPLPAFVCVVMVWICFFRQKQKYHSTFSLLLRWCFAMYEIRSPSA